jgi:hypothetical protein
MRSAIRKHLVKTFQREFEEQYPQFSLSKLSDGATKVWEWRIAPNLYYFVVLHPFRQEDIFVLEIAWSEDGTFPWASIGGAFEPGKPEWRERLGLLWQPNGRESVWNAAPEVAAAMQANFDAMRRGEPDSDLPVPEINVVIPRIAPLVADCLQKFQQFGMPIFEQVAQHRELSLSGDT